MDTNAPVPISPMRILPIKLSRLDQRGNRSITDSPTNQQQQSGRVRRKSAIKAVNVIKKAQQGKSLSDEEDEEEIRKKMKTKTEGKTVEGEICQKCQQNVAEKDQEIHSKSHFIRYQCSICAYSSYHKKGMRTHIWQRHGNENIGCYKEEDSKDSIDQLVQQCFGLKKLKSEETKELDIVEIPKVAITKTPLTSRPKVSFREISGNYARKSDPLIREIAKPRLKLNRQSINGEKSLPMKQDKVEVKEKEITEQEKATKHPKLFSIFRKSVHFSVKDSIKCKLCTYKLLSRSIEGHVYWHCGDKYRSPYQCSLCDYKSNQTGAISTHLRKKHNGKGERVEIACDQLFAQSVRLSIACFPQFADAFESCKEVVKSIEKKYNFEPFPTQPITSELSRNQERKKDIPQAKLPLKKRATEGVVPEIVRLTLLTETKEPSSPPLVLPLPSAPTKWLRDRLETGINWNGWNDKHKCLMCTRFVPAGHIQNHVQLHKKPLRYRCSSDDCRFQSECFEKAAAHGITNIGHQYEDQLDAVLFTSWVGLIPHCFPAFMDVFPRSLFDWTTLNTELERRLIREQEIREENLKTSEILEGQGPLTPKDDQLFEANPSTSSYLHFPQTQPFPIGFNEFSILPLPSTMESPESDLEAPQLTDLTPVNAFDNQIIGKVTEEKLMELMGNLGENPKLFNLVKTMIGSKDEMANEIDRQADFVKRLYKNREGKSQGEHLKSEWEMRKCLDWQLKPCLMKASQFVHRNNAPLRRCWEKNRYCKAERCQLCNEEVYLLGDFVGSLIMHVKIHSSRPNFQCSNCLRFGYTVNDIDEHGKLAHPGQEFRTIDVKDERLEFEWFLLANNCFPKYSKKFTQTEIFGGTNWTARKLSSTEMQNARKNRELAKIAGSNSSSSQEPIDNAISKIIAKATAMQKSFYDNEVQSTSQTNQTANHSTIVYETL